jgi:hypothetical protein
MTTNESSISLYIDHAQSSQPILVSFSIMDNCGQCLYTVDLDLSSVTTTVDMPFNFNNNNKKLLLQIETINEDIRNFPLLINGITLDDLFTMPFIVHTGIFYSKDNIDQHIGNCLYAAGKLEYTFPIPLIMACNIIPDFKKILIRKNEKNTST